MTPLSIWNVYDHPSDFPEGFLARRAEISPGWVQHTNDILTAETLQDLRDLLPYGLTMLPRNENEDPVIVEVWL